MVNKYNFEFKRGDEVYFIKYKRVGEVIRVHDNYYTLSMKHRNLWDLLWNFGYLRSQRVGHVYWYAFKEDVIPNTKMARVIYGE